MITLTSTPLQCHHLVLEKNYPLAMRTLDLVRAGYISVLLFCSELCLANTWWEVTITDDVLQKCASPRKPGMVFKGSLFLSQNVATEYQCYALCLYTRPCDSFSWQKTVRLCQLRNSVATPSNLPSLVDKEWGYERKAEPLCMVRYTLSCIVYVAFRCYGSIFLNLYVLRI